MVQDYTVFKWVTVKITTGVESINKIDEFYKKFVQFRTVEDLFREQPKVLSIQVRYHFFVTACKNYTEEKSRSNLVNALRITIDGGQLDNLLVLELITYLDRL